MDKVGSCRYCSCVFGSNTLEDPPVEQFDFGPRMLLLPGLRINRHMLFCSLETPTTIQNLLRPVCFGPWLIPCHTEETTVVLTGAIPVCKDASLPMFFGAEGVSTLQLIQ